MKTNLIKLPLAYSSHRQIMDADRNVVLEVFSGGPGIDAADQLQDLVVVACNSHGLLVAALERARESMLRSYCDLPAIRQIQAALDAAGAA